MELDHRRSNLTEEQQGGNEAPAEANAEAQATDQTVGTVAVADEPATSPNLDDEANGTNDTAAMDAEPVMAAAPEAPPATEEAETAVEAEAPTAEAEAPAMDLEAPAAEPMAEMASEP